MFGQILPNIYSFGPKCQKLSLQIYSFCEIKLKILQLKSNQIYNLRLCVPHPYLHTLCLDLLYVYIVVKFLYACTVNLF